MHALQTDGIVVHTVQTSPGLSIRNQTGTIPVFIRDKDLMLPLPCSPRAGSSAVLGYGLRHRSAITIALELTATFEGTVQARAKRVRACGY
jgi:hypothetical protein